MELGDWARYVRLTQDLSRRREECVRDEAELAERAKKIKAAPTPLQEPLPAVVGAG